MTIKFAHKFDAPATLVNENDIDEVALEQDRVVVKAHKGTKHFALDLILLRDIDPANSTWVAGGAFLASLGGPRRLVEGTALGACLGYPRDAVEDSAPGARRVETAPRRTSGGPRRATPRPPGHRLRRPHDAHAQEGGGPEGVVAAPQPRQGQALEPGHLVGQAGRAPGRAG